MIREKTLFCKLIRINKSSKFFFDGSMAHFIPGLAVCPCCGARGRCAIHAYYDRHIIDYCGGKRTKASLCVLRLKCSSCGHTHAVLPDVIIPYDSYGLLFILQVLAEYFLFHTPIERLCEKFGLSRVLFYKWLALWKSHKKEWLGLLADAETSDASFISTLLAMDPFSEFTGAFFRLLNRSFLQSHRNPANSRRRPVVP